jgi:hypothetical protein
MGDFLLDKVTIAAIVGGVFFITYLATSLLRHNRPDFAKAIETIVSGGGLVGAASMVLIAIKPSPEFLRLSQSADLRFLLYLGATSVGWTSIATFWSCVRAAGRTRATLLDRGEGDREEKAEGAIQQQ